MILLRGRRDLGIQRGRCRVNTVFVWKSYLLKKQKSNLPVEQLYPPPSTTSTTGDNILPSVPNLDLNPRDEGVPASIDRIGTSIPTFTLFFSSLITLTVTLAASTPILSALSNN